MLMLVVLFVVAGVLAWTLGSGPGRSQPTPWIHLLQQKWVVATSPISTTAQFGGLRPNETYTYKLTAVSDSCAPKSELDEWKRSRWEIPAERPVWMLKLGGGNVHSREYGTVTVWEFKGPLRPAPQYGLPEGVTMSYRTDTEWRGGLTTRRSQKLGFCEADDWTATAELYHEGKLLARDVLEYRVIPDQ